MYKGAIMNRIKTYQIGNTTHKYQMNFGRRSLHKYLFHFFLTLLIISVFSLSRSFWVGSSVFRFFTRSKGQKVQRFRYSQTVQYFSIRMCLNLIFIYLIHTYVLCMLVQICYYHEIEAKIWACLSRASAVQVPNSQKSEFAAPKS